MVTELELAPLVLERPRAANGPSLPRFLLPRDGAWTVADLELFSHADDLRYELAHGRIIMMSPASPTQGRHAVRLATALQNFVDERNLGEVYSAEPGFELRGEPDPIVRAPDVAYVSLERLPPEDEQAGFWKVAPDLAVEIISPSETANQIDEKVEDYLAVGVRLVWLVYPRRKKVIERRPDGGYREYKREGTLDGGDVLPGFTYPLARLFRETTKRS